MCKALAWEEARVVKAKREVAEERAGGDVCRSRPHSPKEGMEWSSAGW